VSTASTVTGVTAFDNVLQENAEQKINILSPDSGKNFDTSTYAPCLVPSFNFAAYVNNSPSLQKWIQLGVDLAKLERKKGIPQYIMRLDFERDMKAHIQ
jgi:mTERF domain-containing protein